MTASAFVMTCSHRQWSDREFDEPQKPESSCGLAAYLHDLRRIAELLGVSVSSSLKWS